MVDIEERSLRAFEQYFFASLHGTMEIDHRVRYVWPQFFAGGQVAFVDFPKTDRLCTERLKDPVVLNNLRL